MRETLAHAPEVLGAEEVVVNRQGIITRQKFLNERREIMKSIEDLERMLVLADKLDREAALLAAYGESRLASVKWDKASDLRSEVREAMATVC